MIIGIAIIVSWIIGFIVGAIWIGKNVRDSLIQDDKKIIEQKIFRDILLKWIMILQDDKALKRYFENKHYEHVAIYGFGDLGERFYYCLKKADIPVDYIIDRNAATIDCNISAYTLNDDLSPVDVIIVTPIQLYETIKKDIRGKVNYPIVSLEDIIYECEYCVK